MKKLLLLAALLCVGCSNTLMMDDGLPCVRDGMGNYVTQVHGKDVCIIAYKP